MQLYKCHDCGRQFVDNHKPSPETLISDYIDNKLTLKQLSQKYNLSIKTVWNKIGEMKHIRIISKDKNVVINMDTTYWGRNYGLMIIKDAFRNKILWYKFLRYESVTDYCEGVQWLRDHGFVIYGIVCDGIRGLFISLRNYRVQMCQFHMIQIVKRHLTSKPDLDASKELLALTCKISRTTEDAFRCELEKWHLKWCKFLNEKRIDETGKSHFVHIRTRAAYNSLKYYLPYLWTFERYPELHIPNTNAAIESLNQRLKTLLRTHSGITKIRRTKLLQEFIARNY